MNSLITIFGIISFLYLTFNKDIQIRWISDQTNWNDMTEFLLSLNYPVILLDTPLSYHNISQWTFEELADQINGTISCKYSTEPVFQYHATKWQPLDDIHEFTISKTYYNVMISPQELFNEIQNDKAGQYFYSSGSIDNLNLTFLVDQSISNITFPPHKGRGQVNYWFGGTNVTAYTHYDTSHNLHLMIKGKKRFILYPPSYHALLNLYPCLHSLYRQIQVNDIEPYLMLDILPGQVLYLPPYWFHTVITLQPSLSLNIWSDSNDYLLMEKIFNFPIPFESEWGHEVLMKAVTFFINSLLSIVNLPKEFVQTTVFKRYELLVAKLSSDDMTAYEVNVQKYCQPLSSTFIENYIMNKTIEIGSVFLKMSANGVMEINLANYIEHVVYTILYDNVKELPFYFKQCF